MGIENILSVSVIVPAYNTSRYLTETVKSVLNQSHEDWELLIINDGSTDNTLEVAKELANTDVRISVLDKKNGGVSSARNMGIQHAKGDYLAFLDADDIWEPSFLGTCLDHLKENSEDGLVHSDLVVVNEHGIKTGQSKEGRSGKLLNDLLAWEGHSMSPPSGILVRKSVFQSVGLFDENVSNNADQDFYIRCASQFNIGRVPQPLLNYRIHNNNMHGNISVLEHDSLYVFRKAAKNGLFYNAHFRRKCFSNVFLILSVNYLKHNQNWLKSFQYLCRALFSYPLIIRRIFKKLMK